MNYIFLTKHMVDELKGKTQEELISMIDGLWLFIMARAFNEDIEKNNPELYRQMCERIESFQNKK